ncbi:MAG: HD domain-containing protein [Desulfonauticus sp.]|nr:HD domain-containing protein [Desulfonauticus sp.]
MKLTIAPYLSWFQQYTKKFYTSDKLEQRHIFLKEEHSLRVYDNALNIVKVEKCSEKLKFCVEFASLFHDLGRFEQYKRYKTFKDSESVNHAVLGYNILTSQDFWKDLPEEFKKYIGIAILMHNRLHVSHKFPENISFVIKVVRDADKLDIFRVILEHLLNSQDNEVITLHLEDDKQKISPEIIADLEAGKLVDYNKMRYVNDFKLLLASWVYDFNFAYTYKTVLEQGYLEKLFSLLPNRLEVRKIESRLTCFLKCACEK